MKKQYITPQVRIVPVVAGNCFLNNSVIGIPPVEQADPEDLDW